ncbi:MAG: hypothetical protein LBL75_01835 [Rickettsiales bacterium]|jgi:hypothetical protein|nr:hypothetical protein [Rickettsiales bacterium]
MKKILVSIFGMLVALPVLATDDTIANATELTESVATATDTIKSDIGAAATEINAANPDAKFPNGLKFGIGASATGGVDGFVGYNNKKFDSFWWKRLGLRVNYSTTSPVKSLIARGVDSAIGDGVELGDDIKIDSGKISATNFGAVVDFYPFGDTWFLGGWRISGGYVSGKLNADTNLAGEIPGIPGAPIEFTLGHTKYRYNDSNFTGNAKVDWKYSGPYAGTGFDLGLFAGIKIYLDAGVVFTSKTAQLGLDIPLNNKLEKLNTSTGLWQNVEIAGLQSEFDKIKADAIAEGQEELDKLTFFPIIKLGLMYRF